MNTLFQKMRNNRQKAMRRAPPHEPTVPIDERRAVVWKFLARGGKINGVNDGFVGNDDRVILHDLDAPGGPKKYEFMAGEYNAELSAWRAAMLPQKADATQPAPPETPQQRWYRNSAWFKGGEK